MSLRVFVSYARVDGAQLALRLEKDLTAAGFDVWLDTQRIHGGASWTEEIEHAIDRAQVALAVLTRGSYQSATLRNYGFSGRVHLLSLEESPTPALIPRLGSARS